MRLTILLCVLLACAASAQPWGKRRIRQPCASNGMSCSPGPCCQGLKCDELGICKDKPWSEGRKDPGPDDKTKTKPKPAATK